MAPGIQPAKAFLDQQATNIVLALRTDMENVQRFNAYIQALGVSGLTAPPLNYATADAQTLLSVFANLDAIRSLAEGNAYSGPALPFNFVEQTIPLWSGQ